MLRFPAQFIPYFRAVDGIAEIVPQPVCDKLNQCFIFSVFMGTQFIQYRANGFYNLDIAFFTVSADTIGFPNRTFVKTKCIASQ